MEEGEGKDLFPTDSTSCPGVVGVAWRGVTMSKEPRNKKGPEKEVDRRHTPTHRREMASSGGVGGSGMGQAVSRDELIRYHMSTPIGEYETALNAAERKMRLNPSNRGDAAEYNRLSGLQATVMHIAEEWAITRTAEDMKPQGQQRDYRNSEEIYQRFRLLIHIVPNQAVPQPAAPPPPQPAGRGDDEPVGGGGGGGGDFGGGVVPAPAAAAPAPGPAAFTFTVEDLQPTEPLGDYYKDQRKLHCGCLYRYSDTIPRVHHDELDPGERLRRVVSLNSRGKVDMDDDGGYFLDFWGAVCTISGRSSQFVLNISSQAGVWLPERYLQPRAIHTNPLRSDPRLDYDGDNVGWDSRFVRNNLMYWPVPGTTFVTPNPTVMESAETALSMLVDDLDISPTSRIYPLFKLENLILPHRAWHPSHPPPVPDTVPAPKGRDRVGPTFFEFITAIRPLTPNNYDQLVKAVGAYVGSTMQENQQNTMSVWPKDNILAKTERQRGKFVKAILRRLPGRPVVTEKFRSEDIAGFSID